MAISTNGTVLTRLAGALYNTQMSNATYKEVAALDPSALANVLYSRDFNMVSDATVATTLVANLGLTAVEGLANWVAAQLTAAGANKGAKVVELLNGFAQMSSDATYGTAASAFNAKVDQSLALSQTTDNTGGSFDAISTAVNGKSFTLTAGIDNLVGTSGDDTFNASLISSAASLQSSDAVNGGTGSDTLNVLLSGTTVVPVSLSSIETVNVTNTAASTAATISLSSVAGLTSVGVVGSSYDQTISGLDSAATQLIATGNVAPAVFTFKNAALSGSADTVSLKVSGHTGNITVDADGTNDIETFNLDASGTSSTIGVLLVKDSGSATTATKLVLSGDAPVTIGSGTALGAAIATVDASTRTASVTLTTDVTAATVTGGSANDVFTFQVDGNVSLIGGAGNDTFAFGVSGNTSGAYTSSDTIDGGDGNDTIKAYSADLAVSATQTKLSNVEALTYIDAAAAALDVTYYGAGLNTVNMAVASNSTVDFTLNAGASTVTTLNSITDSTTSFTVGGTGQADSVTLKLNSAAGTAALGTGIALSGVGVETLTVQTLNNAESIASATLTGTGGAATKIAFTGAKGITVHTAGKLEAKTVDASGLTVSATDSGLTMVAAATTNLAQTLIGSGAKDTLIGGASNDSIDGGGSNDAITAGAGNDTVLGGDGNDTITFDDSFATGDSIDGGAGTDTLVISNTSLTTINAYSISAANTLNDRVSNIERVEMTALNQDIDLGRLDGISYVTLSSTAPTADTISGFAAASTVVLTVDSSDLNVTLADATGASDEITFVTQKAGTLAAATLTVGTSTAAVEKVTIRSTEGSTPNATVRSHTANLDSSTGLTTLVLTGTETIATTVSSTALSSVDASGMGEGGVNVDGSASLVATTVTGSNNNDTLISGSGSDSVNAGTGDDSVTGGIGNDSLSGGEGNDTVVAGVGSDVLAGDAGTDTVSATGWTISTTTDGGSSAVTGLAINIGSSAVTASTINTAMSDDLNAEILSLAAGQLGRLGTTATVSSRVTSLTSIENVTGSSGADFINGSSSANEINGGDGADYIIAGGGSDTVSGGAGADIIFLNTTATAANATDADVVRYATSADFSSAETITGFTSGNDAIAFLSSVFSASGAGVGTTTAANSSTLFTATATDSAVTEGTVFIEMAVSATMFNATTAANATSVAAILTDLVMTGTTTDAAVVFITDGTDGYLWFYDENGTTGTSVVAAEMTMIAKLLGVSNIADADLAFYS
jgi:Ca2+-binding RTX toxin-like protein